MQSVAYWFLTLLVIAGSLSTGCTGGVDLPSNDNADTTVGNDNESGNDNTPTDGASETCDLGCDLGEVCSMGICTPTDLPQVEFGFTDFRNGVYSPFTEGGILPYFTAGQGGSHTFFTIRTSGISTSNDGRIDVDYQIIRRSDGFVLTDFQQRTEVVMLDDETFEAERRLVFILDFPELLDGVVVDCTFVVTSPVDFAQTATIERSLVLDFFR